MRNFSKKGTGGWSLAVGLVQDYLRKPAKVDVMMARLPENLSSQNRRLCQFLFLGVIRHKRLIEWVVGGLVEREPGDELRGYLYVGVLEMLLGERERWPKVVDYVVGEGKRGGLSRGKVGFLNAVLRRVPGVLEGVEGLEMGLRWSHPEWLVERWLGERSGVDVGRLLEWDQGVPGVYFSVEAGVDVSGYGEVTEFEGFYRLKEGCYEGLLEGLKAGGVYVQDPSTAVGVGMVDWAGVGSVLDLCAAPGGKSMGMVRRMGGGVLVAVDLGGERFGQLEENLGKVEGVAVHAVEADVLELGVGDLEGRGLPGGYDVVYVDVPCSNTGVLQRRPDVKWRLEAEDFGRLTQLQYGLLKKASEFVVEGGQLVYSTCSVDREENRGVVERFLEEVGGYELVRERELFPPEDGCDGAGVFVFRRV